MPLMSPLHRSGRRALAASILLAATGAFGVSPSAAAPPASPVAAATPSPSAPPSPAAPSTGPAATAAATAAAKPARPPVGGVELARPGVVVSRPAGVPAPPAMPCGSWLVADMTTGRILAAKAPHARYLPASTLKTLAALVLIPKIRPDAVVTANAADANADGTRVGVLPGTAYRARNLFQAMLMSSANDAVYALAQANGGLARTATEMNAAARHLGALDTRAVDPSGLDGRGQASSAYDLALIGRAAMQLPDFRAYVLTRNAEFPGGRGPDGKPRRGFAMQNHNRLLYNYAGTIGIKNGYTVKARQTFIGAATRGGHTYIVTQMAGTNGSWRVTAKLLDWAFRYGGRVAPVGRLVEPGELDRPAVQSQQAPAGAPARAMLAAARGAAVVSPPPLRPWVGVIGLVGAVGLVAAFAGRSPRRRRRRPAGAHRR